MAALLDVESFTHGTVECTDMAATRAFLTDFLGLDIIRPLPDAQYMWKGGLWSIVCVHVDGEPKDQGIENRFKVSVASADEVKSAHAAAQAQREAYGIRQVHDVQQKDGATSFLLQDLNNGWWEITDLAQKNYDEMFENLGKAA